MDSLDRQDRKSSVWAVPERYNVRDWIWQSTQAASVHLIRCSSRDVFRFENECLIAGSDGIVRSVDSTSGA